MDLTTPLAVPALAGSGISFNFEALFNQGFRSNAMVSGRLEDYLLFFNERQHLHTHSTEAYLMNRAGDVALQETRLLSYLLGHTELFDRLGDRFFIEEAKQLFHMAGARIRECKETDYQRNRTLTALDWKHRTSCRGRPNRSYTRVLWEIQSHLLVTAHFGGPLDFTVDFDIRRGFTPPTQSFYSGR